jgi:hypothetical protein
MNKIKSYEQFINESVNYTDDEILNEEFIMEKIDSIVDWFKEKVENKEVKKGDKVEKAKHFNMSDFTRFIKSILPSYSNLKEKKQREAFLKKIDKYLEPFSNIISLATFLFLFSDQFKELLMNSLGTGGILTTWGVVFLGRLFNKICQNSVADETSINIKVEKSSTDGKVKVDFDFYYDVTVGKENRILHSSFMRLLQKYEKESWAGIEWGIDSLFKSRLPEDQSLQKPPRYQQHVAKMDFYPLEFVDLLFDTAFEIYDERVEYAEEHDMKFQKEWIDDINTRKLHLSFPDYKESLGDVLFHEDKGSVNVEFYVRKLSNKQLIDLAKNIDNLKLEYHKPIDKIYRTERRRDED